MKGLSFFGEICPILGFWSMLGYISSDKRFKITKLDPSWTIVRCSKN